MMMVVMLATAATLAFVMMMVVMLATAAALVFVMMMVVMLASAAAFALFMMMVSAAAPPTMSLVFRGTNRIKGQFLFGEFNTGRGQHFD